MRTLRELLTFETRPLIDFLKPYSIVSRKQQNPHTKFIQRENDSHFELTATNAYQDLRFNKKLGERNN